MTLSAEEVAGDQYQLFESWYNKLDPKHGGSIQAGTAAQFLKKSGLNDSVLSRIWDLSDPGGKGYLDKAGLFVALKLVALVQNGKEPNLANVNTVTSPPNMGEAPPHPPPPQSKSPGPPLVPAPPAPTVNSTGVWTITPSDRARYDQIFNSLGPEANKIHGNKVRGVMLNSKLPMDSLSKIWDLADMDKDGSLDRVEFSIAMHLIYKVLENNPLPVAIPQEMLSSARRAGVAGQGPVPTPLAPPSQALVTDNNNKLQTSGPPPAPWVVSAADKARYDVMFHNADLDKDGYVSGQEIKGVFLQSGLPQMVLAHIWNICDMKQTGKLTSEQFALAMWLIQQKIAGVDPPSSLTPEMIPPTMRPKPATEPVAPKPTYSNPELQAVADEIEELSKDKLKLESDIQQKEASIRVKNNEIKNLQTELDTLSATLKQLENQKGAAQKRLDDLGQQKDSLDQQLQDIQAQILTEREEVEALRTQVEEQETSLQAQEEEVMSKQKELNDLRAQEMELEASVLSMKNKIESLTSKQQETLLFISQVKNKIEELQDQERHMTEVMTAYDTAIAADDATTLSESALMEVQPNFSDPQYMKVGPSDSPVRDALSPVMSPVSNQNLPNANGSLSDTANETTPKVKDTSFIGGHDPFAQVFGGSQPNADPFAVWDSTKSNPTPDVPSNVDPFGGDAFVAKTAPPVPPPAVISTNTAASKKSKQPPPRPAPPKTRPVKPPPPQYNPQTQTNSNNNPATNDPFGGGGGAWNDSSKSSKNGGFADFSKFPEFEAKYSSASSSSSLKFPWGEEFSQNGGGGGGATTTTSSSSTHKASNGKLPADPFENALSSRKSHTTPSTNNFINNNSAWGLNSPFGSSGFGSQNGSEAHMEGSDPFGGDYDPFKDSQGIKEADEFSWDDEADALFSDGFSDSGPGNSGGGKDPFSLDDFSPEPKVKNSWNVNSPLLSNKINSSSNNNNIRSKSALGDPVPLNTSESRIPARSKTSLGNPGKLDFDFDPLSSSKTSFPTWKSNEDLLNENLNSGSTTTAGKLVKNDNDAWGDATWGNSFSSKPSSDINFNSKFINDPFGSKGAWDSIPARGKGEDEAISSQEQADLELAMALSRSLVQNSGAAQGPHNRTARSPSTGL